MAKLWICSSNPDHKFISATVDNFCDKCPPYSGVLIENEDTEDSNLIQSNSNDDNVKIGVGLYMFLVDSSGSMFNENAFPEVNITRAKLVSAQISGAIFNMEETTKKEDAYIFILLFDHTLKPFINFMSLDYIFKKFKSAQELESSLFHEMEKMKGATDINLALKTAYFHAQKFINGELETIGKIEPMCHAVFNPNTGDDKIIPNVRCLIFTDGQQYTGPNSDNHIYNNPFDEFIYNGENINILMAAYHGNSTDNGCSELMSIVSNCHVHNKPQFFLFDKVNQIGDMYKLFRMASGPSGFCQDCLNSLKLTDR